MRRILKIILLPAAVFISLAGCSPFSSASSSVSDVSSETGSANPTLSVSSTASLDPETKPSEISFYSLNDTHGAIEESGSGSSYEPGMSKLSYAIRHDADYSASSVLLSAGDMFQGTALSNISQGLCMVDIMNQMGFAAMAIGNHEFDWGIDKIVAEEQKADFPYLGINIYSRSTSAIADFAAPSAIISRGGAKIGIIGSILSSIASSISASQIQDIEFLNDIPLVISEAKRLKQEEGCDIVIVATHQGYGTAPQAYLDSGFVDGVFGGHDHMFDNYSYNGKYFIEAGSSGKAYGKMTFKLSDGAYSVKSADYVKLSSSSGTDSAVDKIISSYEEEIAPIEDEVVGQTDGQFVVYKSHATEDNPGSLGALVTDGMLYYAKHNGSDAVAAFHNYGGLRADWDQLTENQNGRYDITVADLYRTFPFDNLVQTISITGTAFKSAAGSDAYSSNVTRDSIGNYYIDGKEIVSDATYTVVTLDFLITRSGDPLYKGIGQGTNINCELEYVRDCLAYFIQCHADSFISTSEFQFAY